MGFRLRAAPRRDRAPLWTGLLAALVVAACGASAAAGVPAVVATVASQKISGTVFDLRLQSAETALKQGGASLSPGSTGYTAMVNQLRASVMRGLIVDAVIAQEASRLGLAATSAAVSAEIASDAHQAGSMAKLQTQLAQAGGSLPQLQDEVRSSLNESVLEDHFAQERAQLAISELAAGTSFATVAQQVSDDDNSRPNGGALTLTSAQLQAGDPAFARGVEALQVGALPTAPFRDAAGYEIIRVDSVSGDTRNVSRILVAAPQPYTVRDRPPWFEEAVAAALAQYCAQGLVTVNLDAGVQPCAVAASSPPSPTVPGQSAPAASASAGASPSATP